jgi:hypothetical protein
MPKLIDVKDFVVLLFYKLPVPEMPLTPTLCIPAHQHEKKCRIVCLSRNPFSPNEKQSVGPPAYCTGCGGDTAHRHGI